MSCLIFITENNNLIISEDNKTIEKEESLCIIQTPSGCFIFETEDGEELTTENQLFLELENSSCQVINITPLTNNKITKPYVSFTRRNGFKYFDENPLKYNSLLSE
jgi:hypothetical protein